MQGGMAQEGRDTHPEHPREATDAHGEVGHDAGLRGEQVCTERQAAVEACMGLEVRVRVRVGLGAGGARGEGVTYQRKTSMHTHTKKPAECACLQPVDLHMPAPVWEDTHTPIIASILFLSVHSCSSSLSTAPSFCPLLRPRLAHPQHLTHALPEWVYQVDVAGTTVVVGLVGRLFHIYDMWQMRTGGVEPVQ